MSCYGANSLYAIVTILGKHDGTIKGVKYFKCKDKHGLFAHQDKIIRDPSITGLCKKPAVQSRLLTLSKSSDGSLSSPDKLHAITLGKVCSYIPYSGKHWREKTLANSAI